MENPSAILYLIIGIGCLYLYRILKKSGIFKLAQNQVCIKCFLKILMTRINEILCFLWSYS